MRNPFLKFIGLEFRTIGIATGDLISTVALYPFVILGGGARYSHRSGQRHWYESHGGEGCSYEI